MSWNTRNGSATSGGVRAYANEAWNGAITSTKYPVQFTMYAAATAYRAVLTITDTTTGLVVATVTPTTNWAFGSNAVNITSSTPGVTWTTAPTNFHTYTFSLYSAADGYITPTPWPARLANFPGGAMDIVLVWGQSNCDVAPTWGSTGTPVPSTYAPAPAVFQLDYRGVFGRMNGTTVSAYNTSTSTYQTIPIQSTSYRIVGTSGTTTYSTGYVVDGVKPDVAFANAYTTRTSRPVCLVPIALGSTGFTINNLGTGAGLPFASWTTWISTYAGGLTSTNINGVTPVVQDDMVWALDSVVYNAAVARAKAAFVAATAAGYTPTFKLMIGVHGEEDSSNGLDPASYAMALSTFIFSIREDLLATHSSASTMGVILGGWGDATMYTPSPGSYSYSSNAAIDTARQWVATGTTGASTVSSTNTSITNPTYAGSVVSLASSTVTPAKTDGTTTAYVFTCSNTSGFVIGASAAVANVTTGSTSLNGTAVVTAIVANTSLTLTYASPPASSATNATLTSASITRTYAGYMPLAGFAAVPYVAYAPTTTAAGYGTATTGSTPHFSATGMHTLGAHMDYILQAGFTNNTSTYPQAGIWSGLGASVPSPLTAYNFGAADRDLGRWLWSAAADVTWVPTTQPVGSVARPLPILKGRAAPLPVNNWRSGRAMRNTGSEFRTAAPTGVSPSNTSGGGTSYTFTIPVTVFSLFSSTVTPSKTDGSTTAYVFTCSNTSGFAVGDTVLVSGVLNGSTSLNNYATLTSIATNTSLTLTYASPPGASATNATLTSATIAETYNHYAVGDWVTMVGITGGSTGLNALATISAISQGVSITLLYPTAPATSSVNPTLGAAYLQSTAFGTLALPMVAPGPAPSLSTASFTVIAVLYRTVNNPNTGCYMMNWYNAYAANIGNPNGNGASLNGGGSYTNGQTNTPYTAAPWYTYNTASNFVSYDRGDFRSGTLTDTRTNTMEIWSLVTAASGNTISTEQFQIAFAGDGGSPAYTSGIGNPTLPLNPCPLEVGAIELGGLVGNATTVPGFNGTWVEFYVWNSALTTAQVNAVVAYLRVVDGVAS